jgi:CheY-like chemotaxis protein
MTEPPVRPFVLLVEDFDDAREMYRDYLHFAGFRVETARDGREAIEKARALRPHLILMDLSLPGIDGWEATRILKNVPATAHLITSLSARAAPEGDRARAAGCDGFIAKPCLPADPLLVRCTSSSIPNHRAARAATARAVADGAHHLLVEDHQDTRQMYAEFLALQYEVLEAATAAAAMQQMSRRRPDVLITDVSLPDFDGFELVTRMRESGPGLGAGDLPQRLRRVCA